MNMADGSRSPARSNREVVYINLYSREDQIISLDLVVCWSHMLDISKMTANSTRQECTIWKLDLKDLCPDGS